MTGSDRVTKRHWYDLGGFANPRCWRRHVAGIWRYYVRRD